MLTSIPERHDILCLSEIGLLQIWERLNSAYPDKDTLKQYWDDQCKLPAITRYWDRSADCLLVGVSFPIRWEGTRCRMSSALRQEDIGAVITPEQAAQYSALLEHPCGDMLRTVLDVASSMGIDAGVYGSTALAGVTGLNYLHENSDLDLVITPMRGADLHAFFNVLTQLEKIYSRRIDSEVALGDGHYVKLKELLSTQQNVLAKGEAQPVLRSSQDVWAKICGLADKEKSPKKY